MPASPFPTPQTHRRPDSPPRWCRSFDHPTPGPTGRDGSGVASPTAPAAPRVAQLSLPAKCLEPGACDLGGDVVVFGHLWRAAEPPVHDTEVGGQPRRAEPGAGNSA